MSKTETILSSLRDIREPIPPESMSLWLITGNIVLLLTLSLLLWLQWSRHQNTWRREALREIDNAETCNDVNQGIVKLAKLLRKLALKRNANIKNLQGHDWLVALNSLFSTDWFTEDSGQIFGDDIYRNQLRSTEELTALSKKLRHLVTTLPAKALKRAKPS